MTVRAEIDGVWIECGDDPPPFSYEQALEVCRIIGRGWHPWPDPEYWRGIRVEWEERQRARIGGGRADL